MKKFPNFADFMKWSTSTKGPDALWAGLQCPLRINPAMSGALTEPRLGQGWAGKIIFLGVLRKANLAIFRYIWEKRKPQLTVNIPCSNLKGHFVKCSKEPFICFLIRKIHTTWWGLNLTERKSSRIAESGFEYLRVCSFKVQSQ